MTRKQSREERLKELREIAKLAIDDAQDGQKGLWEFLEIDVHAASWEVNGREHQLIWTKIEELTNANAYPLWMDAVLTILTSVIPVSAIVGGIGRRLAVSKKLPMLTKPPVSPRIKDALIKRAKRMKDSVALKNAEGLKVTLKAGKHPDVEARKAWHAVGRVYKPELEDALRSTITIAAKSQVEPLYNKDDVGRGVPTAQKQVEKDNTGLPAVTVFKSLLQWIEISRSSDEEILNLLKALVENIEDEDLLKYIPEYLEHDDIGISSTPGRLDKGPTEFFQRFVEACFWCTTYDFTPTFKPEKRTMGVGGGIGTHTPQHFELFPFPTAFWDNLVARHYDPFFGRGDKTYKEVGRIGWIGPAGLYNPPSVEIATLLETGMTFDPRTRLSIHWSGILAPELMNANVEITRALDSSLPEQ